MRNRDRARKQLRVSLISTAVASCFAGNLALANPTGPTVVSGTVSFQQQGNLLQVTNSPNSIINWQSFSIGANEITRFLQQSASSAVLNRVITQNPSSILGALQSNGRVFLINPNGILFGPGAQVDVAGLVASTLNLSDADFLAGRLRFTEVPDAGSVINQGAINAASGGQVYLVGPAVTNSGVITSPKGDVILAAGNSVELVNPGTPNLRVEITASDNQAVNLGRIVADAGRVGIYAGLIGQSGTIRADSAVATEDGRIVLKATKNATLESGSLTSASGPAGGSVTVQSGDTTLVSGAIDAMGTESKGGSIQVLGHLVGLTDAASINASGETGGGTVLVGGDFQGKNPEIQNALRTYVAPHATIKADAITTGDGGKVIVWSDDATRFYGSVSARGGSTSGNGGFAEISGKESLAFNGNVNLSAPSGTGGMLLLDPRNTTIAEGGHPTLAAAGDANANNILEFFEGGETAEDRMINAAAITAVTNTGVAVTVQTNTDLTVNQAIISAGTGSLTLHAGDDIFVNQPIAIAGALSMFAGHLDGTPTDPNADPGRNITVAASITSGPQAITAGGGLIVQSSPGNPAQLSASGGQVIDAAYIEVTAQGAPAMIANNVAGGQSINAGGITLRGSSSDNGNSAIIASNSGSQLITVGPGNISLIGGTGGTNNNAVIRQAQSGGNQSITVEGGGLELRGGTGNNNAAVIHGYNQLITTTGTTGDVTLKGGATAGSAARIGGLAAGGGNPEGPTDLTLNVGGHLSLQGGTGAPALIGNTGTAPMPSTDIAIDAAGNVTLTGGTGAGGTVRIGSGTVGTIPNGDISIRAGGSIALDGSTGQAVRIRTAKNVTLLAENAGGTVSETGNSVIVANELTTKSNAGTNLGGANQVSVFNATNTASGDIVFNNTLLPLTVTGVSQVPGGALTINQAGDLTLTGNISSGPQTITATGNISVLPSSPAIVSASGPQTVTALGTLTVQGGAGGVGQSAQLLATGDQTISASSIAVVGGSGTNNFAEIRQTGAIASQSVNASSISITGGSGGPSNFARIRNDGSGPQTITGLPAITITGGTGGALDQGNFAQIRAAGRQDITAGNTSLVAGASGFSNFAGIHSPDQDITVHGDLALSGGGSAAGPTSPGAARIGGIGGVAPGPTNLLLTVDGNVTMIGGSAANAGAVIGSNFLGGQPTNITMDVGGDLTLGTGTVPLSSARIGSPSTNIAGGNISISTGGDITLANAAVAGTRSVIRTLGSLTLDANNISVGGSLLSGTQTINATGDITVSAPNAVNALVSATGPQSITAGGALTVQGGAGTGLSAQILGSAGQTINASGISVIGGLGSNSFAEIHQTGAGFNQTLTVTGGGTLAMQGGLGGADSFARIRNDGLNQLVNFPSGGAIVITGGSGPDPLPDPGDTANNFARIENRSLTGLQTVNTGTIVLNGALSGAGNFAGIQAAHQVITTTGDVTLYGGPAFNSGSRIGAVGNTSPTDLVLNVGGSLTLNGGSFGGGAIGSNREGNQPTNIVINAVGDITLNPGSGAGPRIGSPEVAVAGGNISLTSPGGNIALNSTPGISTSIRTLGNVALNATGAGKGIMQGADSVIQATQLTTASNAGTHLGGANQVAVFNATNTTSGDVLLKNTSPLLTVTGVSQVPGGALTLYQTGDLTLTGNISSGPQMITATGNISVVPSSPTVVSASGAQTINAGRALLVQGGTTNGSSASIVSSGPVNVSTGGDLSLLGGSGNDAYALLFGKGDIYLTIGGLLRINQGSGEKAWARIQTETRDSVISIYFPNLASGGWFVNDIEGALRRGHTGLLSGNGVAVPEKTLDITYGIPE